MLLAWLAVQAQIFPMAIRTTWLNKYCLLFLFADLSIVVLLSTCVYHAGFKDFDAEFDNVTSLVQSMDSQRDGGELVESVRRILHTST